MIKNISHFIVTGIILMAACSDIEGTTGSYQNNSIQKDDIVNTDPETTPWTPEVEIAPECIKCDWYFCPPLSEVWKREICFNTCESPQTLYSESECIQYMECDPAQYLIDQIECTTEEGYPGIQDKVCNKGLIQYTNCISDCDEEACNYIDDDCDGQIDEDQLNICGECGIVPSEECNNIDDDCNGTTDEDLIRSCSSECGTGYEICDEGNWISCTAVQPQEEICDGLDNDCDNKIDEELDCVCTIQEVGILMPCQEDPLKCGQGFKTCECVTPDCLTLTMTECYALCFWVPPTDPTDICDPSVGIPLTDEKCNNFDDNCNQQIDENLYAGCYSGPPGTLMIGNCIPGEMVCDAGTWGSYNESDDFIPFYCEGEITPQEEICNGLDDDCDGIADWGEEMKETDVLFIVDWSGSMGDEMSAVMIALNQFAQNYSDEEVIKWAFVRGPVSHGIYDERLEMVQDLTGFSDFLTSLSNMDTSMQSMSTAHEMLLDAIYIAIHNITTILPYQISDFIWLGQKPGIGPKVIESHPPLQNFDISWRASADRVIIVFSDEEPQSFLSPSLTLEDVKMAVSGAPQLKLYTFSKSTGIAQWQDLAAIGGGSWFNLTNNPTNMYANLMDIISEICKDGLTE